MSRALTLVAFVLLTVALAGCSEDKSTTAPPVVTGPTFNYTFPQTGTSHSRVFTEVGSWDYRCTPHAGGGMTGTVIVDAASTVDSLTNPVQVGPGNSFTFQPATVTIRPGGTVRWVNVSSATNHTVTR